jgi:acetyltransferase-like isoleucine patch superfamily enzyme
MKINRLQAVFILVRIFNVLYWIFFPKTCRRILQFLAGFEVGKGTTIHATRFFSFKNLKVGENTIVNSGCYLDNRCGITIGNHVVIAHDTKIYTLGHDIEDTRFYTKGAPVVIEDYAVIFSNVLIMPGVTIRRGAVILPGTVVSKDVEAMNVVGGNPPRLIRMRKGLHTDKRVTNYWFSM